MRRAIWVWIFVTFVLLGGGLVPPSDSTRIWARAEAATQDAGLAPPSVDLGAWESVAQAAEAEIANPETSSATLEGRRSELASWRERLLLAQSDNAPRIATLREQIAALGPVPAEGTAEPEEIAARRAELDDQLTRALAPGLAADEAYRRADGLIREADGLLRARNANAILHRDPAPINPANWPASLEAAQSFSADLWAETQRSWNNQWRRDRLVGALPVLGIALLVAVFLWWRGRYAIERLIHRLQSRVSERWWGVLEMPLSLAQVIVPVGALLFLTNALNGTHFLGPIGTELLNEGLLKAGIFAALALWLGRHIFPSNERLTQILHLTPERRAEGRFHVALYAVIGGVQVFLTSGFNTDTYGHAVTLLTYPFTIAIGILLFRIGQLVRKGATRDTEGSEITGLQSVALSWTGKIAMALGVAGPLIGLIGYVGLAEAIVSPAMKTLGLVALIALLQRSFQELYGLATKLGAAQAREALLPVLFFFAMVLGALPILALIWGARPSDLAEIWVRAQEGFRIGETRISPADFLLLLVVFAVGYGVTKLVQSALKVAVLPKTSLDTGGRNAIVAGTGYVGVTLAVLAAVSAAGLNLASLAFVAGALSVGIGFGLQNIVQNFVSGIILLIERPVAEGDWVEVGGVQGIVRGISIRSTRVETFDRTSVIVPNASLIAGQVTNFTAFNLSGRLVVPISVAYGSDTRKVEQILREITEAQSMVLLNPAPSFPLMRFGADGIDFEIRAILRDVNFGTTVRSDINHMIAKRFAEEGIEIPYTQREIRILNLEDLSSLLAQKEGAPKTAPEPPHSTA